MVFTAAILPPEILASWGLINRAVPAGSLTSKGRAFALTPANDPTRAYAATKRMLHAWHSGGVAAAALTHGWPAERAAYVLREAFAYSYEHLAALIKTTDAETRQLVCCARRGLASERRQAVDLREAAQLTVTLIAAAQTCRLAALEQVLFATATNTKGGVRVPPSSRKAA